MQTGLIFSIWDDILVEKSGTRTKNRTKNFDNLAKY